MGSVGLVGSVRCESLWEECLSALEVGESGEFVRIGGDFD